MKLRPIITDEQLRDFRDGILPGAERRLVATQIEVDAAVAERFGEIRSEMPGLQPDSPSVYFSQKIMAQLAAESLVHEPVYVKRSQAVIKGFFVAFSALFIGSLLLALNSSPATTVQLPALDLQVDWAKLVNGRAFLWSVWLGCLLPAILLAYRQLNRPTALLLVK